MKNVTPSKIRLNRFIANAGVCSRREADKLISMGKITVNNKIIDELGYKVSPSDVVKLGRKILKPQKMVYVLLNKPKGYITTARDPQNRKTVMDLVSKAARERIYSVGRLDKNTTGLLLFTNDGDLARNLSHPSKKVKKIYRIELNKAITKPDLDSIIDGISLEEGKAMVDRIAVLSKDKKNLGIELHIGWNRIVRRIFEQLGYEVIKLDRTVFAGLTKKDLPRGRWKHLSQKEILTLKHFT